MLTTGTITAVALFVLLIGGIPIAIPTVLPITLTIGA